MKLKVQQGYKAGNSCRTQHLSCPKCHRPFTAVTLILFENPPYGRGAYTVANRIRQTGDALQKKLVDAVDQIELFKISRVSEGPDGRYKNRGGQIIESISQSIKQTPPAGVVAGRISKPAQPPARGLRIR
jgi:hypothetical protein